MCSLHQYGMHIAEFRSQKESIGGSDRHDQNPFFSVNESDEVVMAHLMRFSIAT